MAFLFYVRLIALTAGTLVYLFLIALVLGHRRPRRFERLLFFLIFALFLIYAGGLLEINAVIEYGSPPEATQLFFKSVIALGILFLVPLVAQTHVEYLRQIRDTSVSGAALAFSYSWYLLPVGMLVLASNNARAHPGLGFDGLLDSLNRQSGLIVVISAIIAGSVQILIMRSARDSSERNLFRCLCGGSALLIAAPFVGPMVGILPITGGEHLLPAVIVAGVFPGSLLIYYSLKHNFLDFGAQRNLVYALSAMFLALLYLTLVHRVSGWLEPVLPPEATASILLFVLIFLFEPVERAIGPALHRRFKEGMDGMHRLAAELQAEARLGDVARLTAFAEKRIGEEFGLAAVRLSVAGDAAHKPLESPGGLGHSVRVPLVKDGKEMCMLEAASTGTYLTGETSAALEYLAEQLPAMLDLARLIEDKVRLERELAARERLAMLGQMAASVSHNLRNPLSSIKTVLQVQLENPRSPAGRARRLLSRREGN